MPSSDSRGPVVTTSRRGSDNLDFDPMNQPWSPAALNPPFILPTDDPFRDRLDAPCPLPQPTVLPVSEPGQVTEANHQDAGLVPCGAVRIRTKTIKPQAIRA